MDTIVFEVSNEVAHKVGGIYAVIASKAPEMRKNFKEYFTIGPYDPKSINVDFEEITDHPFHQLFLELAEKDIKCVFGKWINADNVNCILVDPIGLIKQRDEIKTQLWNDYAVDSLICDDLFNWSIVWGKAVGMLLEGIMQMNEFSNENIVCQFHEWLTGSALLHMKSLNSRAGLVFTTHATTMGRTMANRGEDLVKEVEQGLKLSKTLNDSKAKEYNIQAIHSLEKACSHNADVFTTVSKVTAEEATYILGRAPDALTLNGLSFSNYPSMEELSISHKESRRKIKHFVQGFFSPYYPLDTKGCLYFFTAGRYEFHNKGYDILIKSLGDLNKKLKAEKSKKSAVVFLWVPAATKGDNIEVLSNMALFEAMEDEVNDNLDEIREHIIESIASGKLPTKTSIFDKPFLQNLKQILARMSAKKNSKPPISVLELSDPNDIILKQLEENGLENKEQDRVKIIFYPTYLSSADGFLGLNYNDAIKGCHLGLFPSYYEPWGYTPLETAAFAVPSITTDLAGFGKFIKDYVGDKKPAIAVLDRKTKGDTKATKQLTDYMYLMVNTTKKERVNIKIEAKKLSEIADWENLIKNYMVAYEMAIKKVGERIENV